MIGLARALPDATRLFFDPMHCASRGEETVAELVARDTFAIVAQRFPERVWIGCRVLAPHVH